jgi:pimeloyl-ACP methyl ester carboxylesterase
MLHSWLGRIGYQSHLSGILLNVQHSERLLSGLARKVAEIKKETGARVSLIGHSRGGLLAKVLSQRRPEGVEQVIALGAPLADWTDLAALTHRAVGVVRTANELAYGRRFNLEGRFTYDLKLSPVVPTTSIYTKTDDVVNFRSCLRPDIPAMPVWGTHNGLVVNPEVFRLVGRLLARPKR